MALNPFLCGAVILLSETYAAGPKVEFEACKESTDAFMRIDLHFSSRV
jgi:hypothetical protein